jgi:hypothetical protein
MAEGVGQRLTAEQRVFLVKTFYQTNNKSETCRRFNEQFNRQIDRHTVTNIVDRFEKTVQLMIRIDQGGQLLLEQ